MKKNSIHLFLCCCSMSIALHAQKKEVIYEVDGIEVDQVFYKELEDLNDSIVHHVNVVEDALQIDDLGYQNTERLIQIYTQAYMKRPDSLKQIPSTKQMERIEAKWYLEENTQPYTGPFRDYYLNGNIQGKGQFKEGKLEGKRLLYYKDGTVSDELNYKNGFPEGEEKRYFPDGTLKQTGNYKEGYEIGEWKKYHPNGILKQVSHFADKGKLHGEVKTYYSTGELKGVSEFKNGELVEARVEKKIKSAYKSGKKSFHLAKFEEAIFIFSKCIELKPTWNDAYFARGAAYMNNKEFDKAIADFNTAIEIEPLDAFAYSNRAFALIKKQEFETTRQKSPQETAAMDKPTKANPDDTLEKICKDLQKAKKLGDDSRMLHEALAKFCLK